MRCNADAPPTANSWVVWFPSAVAPVEAPVMLRDVPSVILSVCETTTSPNHFTMNVPFEHRSERARIAASSLLDTVIT